MSMSKDTEGGKSIQCVPFQNKRSRSTPDDQQTEPCLVVDKWSRCIYRVPGKLRDVNVAAYTPRLISIGPFHHGQEELKDMEMHKKEYSDRFLKRFEGEDELAANTPTLVEQLKGIISDSKRGISSCYAGTINEKGIVDIIQVDACFIFELFWMNYCELKCYDQDYILGSPWLKKAIELELILFENQLPYSLLLSLYEHVFPLLIRSRNSQDLPCSSSSDSLLLEKAQHEHKIVINDEARPTFIELTCMFFKDFCKSRGSFKDGEVEPKHFTDLIRHFMLPGKIGEEMTWDNYTTKCKYSLRMLTTAGVNVSSVKDNKQSLILRITDARGASKPFTDRGASELKKSITHFRNINLELTSFTVKDDTECLVRNVMALEQFVYPKEAYICNYFLVMDKLVDTVEDVDFLVEKGVIINMLGSNVAVAKLVNNLCEHIMEDESCYNHICRELNDHYECSYNRHLVSLKRVYFKDVWTGSATFFGVILVLLTIIQITMSFKASNVH